MSFIEDLEAIGDKPLSDSITIFLVIIVPQENYNTDITDDDSDDENFHRKMRNQTPI
jgi:hypothetical protein